MPNIDAKLTKQGFMGSFEASGWPGREELDAVQQGRRKVRGADRWGSRGDDPGRV
jgi:hypothetical protein